MGRGKIDPGLQCPSWEKGREWRRGPAEAGGGRLCPVRARAGLAAVPSGGGLRGAAPADSLVRPERGDGERGTGDA